MLFRLNLLATVGATRATSWNVASNTVVAPTPAERTLVVVAESRALVVAAESRTLEVAAESRTVVVPPENRTLEA